MQKKPDYRFTIILVLGALLIITGYIAYMYSRENSSLRDSLPYLLKGEKIDYFSLVDMDAKEIDHKTLNRDRVSIIFIMSRPCSPCDKNVMFFKKIAQILKDRVDIYGIVLDTPTEALNFVEKAKPNYKVYAPTHLETFLDKMRIKLNLSQIIVYKNKVELLRLGELAGETVSQLIEFTKRMI